MSLLEYACDDRAHRITSDFAVFTNFSKSSVAAEVGDNRLFLWREMGAHTLTLQTGKLVCW